MDYQGKVALVTGASSGIGTAFAEALAARGMDLVLVARTGPALQEIAVRLSAKYGVRAEVVTADLARPGAAAAVWSATEKLGMPVHLLVNNAGFGSAGRFDQIDADRASREVALDVATVVDLTRAYLPGMTARRAGGVVNVASIAGFQPVPFMAVYGAAKAFVLSFSQGLWAEVRPLGVGVVAVCPGPVATKFMEAVGTTDATVGSARTPEQVVSATLRTLDRGGSMVTPGLPNAALHLINRLLPRRVVLAVGGRRMAVPPSAPAPAPAS